MKKGVLILICCVVLHSCSDRLPLGNKEATINIKNESSKDLYYYVSNKYPDTSLRADFFYILTAYNYYHYHLDKSNVEDYFNESSSGIMNVFFFDADTVNKYGKEVVANQYKILIRKDFSYQELKDNNFTVSYP